MNYNQQFDKYIKDQFSSYSPEVHPRIWEKIAAETDRRKPVGFWYSFFNNKNKLLLLGLLVTLTTGGAWYFINKNTGTENKPIIISGSSVADKGQFNTNKEEATPNTSLNKENLSQLPDNVNTGSNSNNNVNSTLASGGKVKTNIYSPVVASEDDETILADTKTITNKKRKTAAASMLTINATSPELEEDAYEGQGTLLGRLTFNAEKITAARKSKINLPYFRENSFLPGCPSIEKNASGNKKYLEIYGSADYAFRSLSDTANSEYLQKRKESTKFSSAFSAGIRYTRVFNNSMSVRAGINYSQINEKFTFTQGNIVQVTYIIGSNGDTLGSFTTTGTRYKSSINKYRSVDVPVVVGYEVGNGRLHANINAGVVVNLYSWQKGEVLDTAYQPVSITTGKSSSPYQFKTNAGVGFIGGVSVYYKLNDRLHLMAEPYFRYNFSPMNKDNITLKQKYQTAGLRLGVRLDLK